MEEKGAIEVKFEYYKKHINKAFNLIDETALEQAIQFLWVIFKAEDPIFIIGNGGSAANASHFAQDLVKGTYPDYHGLRDDMIGKTFKAISLTDSTSFITATSNDDGYEHIFTNQLKPYASKNMLVIGISGSGNSLNLINAFKWANIRHLPTMSFTGFDGGELKRISLMNVHVPIYDMLLVETVHLFIFHYIIESLKLLRIQDGKNI